MALTLDEAQRIYDAQLPNDDECHCDCKEDDVICADCGEHTEYCSDCGGTTCCGARKMDYDYEPNDE